MLAALTSRINRQMVQWPSAYHQELGRWIIVYGFCMGWFVACACGNSSHRLGWILAAVTAPCLIASIEAFKLLEQRLIGPMPNFKVRQRSSEISPLEYIRKRQFESMLMRTGLLLALTVALARMAFGQPNISTGIDWWVGGSLCVLAYVGIRFLHDWNYLTKKLPILGPPVTSPRYRRFIAGLFTISSLLFTVGAITIMA